LRRRREDVEVNAELGQDEREPLRRHHHGVVAADEAELAASFTANVIAEDGIAVTSHLRDFAVDWVGAIGDTASV